MNKYILKHLFLLFLITGIANVATAQKKKSTKAKVPAKRSSTRRTTKNRTTANIQRATASKDSAIVQLASSDTLPIKRVAKSLRRDGAVDDDVIKERIPLAYENLRADDAVYRHKIWREIDTREKINLPFKYSANEDNGNQRFISILLQAIQDSAVTVFSNVDDRFTTPMTKGEVSKAIAGDEIPVPIYDFKMGAKVCDNG